MSNPLVPPSPIPPTGSNPLDSAQLGRIIQTVVVIAGAIAVLLVVGLLYIAIVHDGSATEAVVTATTGIIAFIVGLIPTLLSHLNQAAGVGQNTTTASITTTQGPQPSPQPGATTTQTTTTRIPPFAQVNGTTTPGVSQ